MRLATIAAAFVLFSAPLAVEAQQPGKVYRVGILTNKASDPAEARLWQAFRSGLRERGWIEGQNILIEFRAAEGNTARLPELAADLVRLKVDLIVARSSIWVQAAKKAISSIPIVFLILGEGENEARQSRGEALNLHGALAAANRWRVQWARPHGRKG